MAFKRFLIAFALLLSLGLASTGIAADATSHIPTESAFTAVPGLGGEVVSGNVVIEADTTWEVPANVNTIYVTLLGGSSCSVPRLSYYYNPPGDDPNTYTMTGSKGGASGGGSYKEIEVTPGEKFPIVIGKGGTGITWKNTTTVDSWGSPGGTTSFGSIFYATGATAWNQPGKGVGGDINYDGNAGSSFGSNSQEYSAPPWPTDGRGGSAPTEYGGVGGGPNALGGKYGAGPGGATFVLFKIDGIGYKCSPPVDLKSMQGTQGVCIINW